LIDNAKVGEDCRECIEVHEIISATDPVRCLPGDFLFKRKPFKKKTGSNPGLLPVVKVLGEPNYFFFLAAFFLAAFFLAGFFAIAF